jgi:hypothetical protein
MLFGVPCLRAESTIMGVSTGLIADLEEFVVDAMIHKFGAQSCVATVGIYDDGSLPSTSFNIDDFLWHTC